MYGSCNLGKKIISVNSEVKTTGCDMLVLFNNNYRF